ncbi:hypothetical protein ACTJIJ_22320 [Niabella sp. 22666]|uniref:hypothetical protein n=1 Tax=Niabella sp. 22666 TaxID=3453954 RepID=UPI003F8715AC
MRKIFICCTLFWGNVVFGQIVNAHRVDAVPGSTFTYNTLVAPYYGLNWAHDPVEPYAGPSAWLSGVALKFFTAGTPKLSIDYYGEVKTEHTLTVNTHPDLNGLRFSSNWTGYANSQVGSRKAEISNDTHTYKTLMLVGNPSSGLGRRVSVWDRLEVNGKLFTTEEMGIGLQAVPEGYKLAVSGKIITEELKVKSPATTWPDYVFEFNYKKMPLPELEQFITKNKHLPEIPSAQQVEKEGIELGTNQAALLKKIEELTLYIIDQNKELKKQNEKISQLEDKLAVIEKKQDFRIVQQPVNE